MFDFDVFPDLHTDRLILRQVSDADAEGIIELFGDAAVLEFLNRDPIRDRKRALDLIRWLRDRFTARDGVQWSLERRADRRFVGAAGWYGWEREHAHVDIGYHVVRELWGQGYATEAATAIVQWCFENLGVNRIQGDCTGGHVASRRVMEKAGFVHEGTWRESCFEHGRFVDIWQFGLLRSEWSPA